MNKVATTNEKDPYGILDSFFIKHLGRLFYQEIGTWYTQLSDQQVLDLAHQLIEEKVQAYNLTKRISQIIDKKYRNKRGKKDVYMIDDNEPVDWDDVLKFFRFKTVGKKFITEIKKYDQLPAGMVYYYAERMVREKTPANYMTQRLNKIIHSKYKSV